MRQADYVYGIVPERGEYGFEVQPIQGDSALLARIQTLASSFQWNATTSEEVVAIAVDRSHPLLIARIATDPRDPNGRLSICMQVWITTSAETLEQMIAEVWPVSVRLPTTQEEFLSVALQRTSGRIVVGPNKSFSAVGFDSSWGVSRVMPDFPNAVGNPKASARRSSSTTDRASKSPRKSFSLLKVVLTLLALALALLIEDFFVDRETRSELQRYKHRVGELESVVAESPGKVDQAELLSLRTFKDAVERYIDSQGRSLQELKDAVPQSPTRLKERTDKVKESIQGKSNNR